MKHPVLCLSKLEPPRELSLYLAAQLIKLNMTKLLRRCNINSTILLNATSEHLTGSVWSVFPLFKGVAICCDPFPVGVLAKKPEGSGMRTTRILEMMRCSGRWQILVYLGAAKLLKGHCFALTLQILVDHLQHLPENHHIDFHA